jgi:hypothetical protein
MSNDNHNGVPSVSPPCNNASTRSCSRETDTIGLYYHVLHCVTSVTFVTHAASANSTRASIAEQKQVLGSNNQGAKEEIT